MRISLLYRLLAMDYFIGLLLHFCLLNLKLLQPFHKFIFLIFLSDIFVLLILGYDLVQYHLVLKDVLLHKV